MLEVLVIEGVWSPALEAWSTRRDVGRVAGGDHALPADLLRGCRTLVVRNALRSQPPSSRRHPTSRSRPALEWAWTAWTCRPWISLRWWPWHPWAPTPRASRSTPWPARWRLPRGWSTWTPRPGPARGIAVHDAISPAVCGACCRPGRPPAPPPVWRGGLGMSVVAYDPYIDESDLRVRSAGIRLASLQEVLDSRDHRSRAGADRRDPCSRDRPSTTAALMAMRREVRNGTVGHGLGVGGARMTSAGPRWGRGSGSRSVVPEGV